eukprot:307098_1
MPLLKYIFKSTKDAKKRIVAVNYYLTIVFANHIRETCLKRINYFAIKHNGTNGLSNVGWTDIEHTGGYVPYWTRIRWVRTILTLVIVMYDIYLMTMLQQHLAAPAEKVFCWIYVVVDGIWTLFDIKYAHVYWICHHIMPFVYEYHLIEYLPWSNAFEDPDCMMQYVKIVYHIMFESVEKTTIINCSCASIQP